jgi:hypothetical protein
MWLDSTSYTAKEMEDIEALYQVGHYHDGQAAKQYMPSCSCRLGEASGIRRVSEAGDR